MDILLALLVLAVGFLLYSAWQLIHGRRNAARSRPDDQDAPLPVRALHVVRRLQEDRSAVLTGASDLSVFMITAGMVVRGSASLFVLQPEPVPEKTA